MGTREPTKGRLVARSSGLYDGYSSSRSRKVLSQSDRFASHSSACTPRVLSDLSRPPRCRRRCRHARTTVLQSGPSGPDRGDHRTSSVTAGAGYSTPRSRPESIDATSPVGAVRPGSTRCTRRRVRVRAGRSTGRGCASASAARLRRRLSAGRRRPSPPVAARPDGGRRVRRREPLEVVVESDSVPDECPHPFGVFSVVDDALALPPFSDALEPTEQSMVGLSANRYCFSE